MAKPEGWPGQDRQAGSGTETERRTARGLAASSVPSMRGRDPTRDTGQRSHLPQGVPEFMKTPTMSLLCKIGSILVHVEEATEPGGHPFDAYAIRSLMSDPEIVEWLAEMRDGAFLPVKRSEPPRRKKP